MRNDLAGGTYTPSGDVCSLLLVFNSLTSTGSMCSAYYDVGRPLSESTVRGQIEGGMAQGIGQTLYEELLYNVDGEMLTTSISDAGVPLANQLPDYKVFLADSMSTLATGAKGVGESPTIGVPPALARAIENQTGVHITETPVRQEILLKQRIRTK